MYTTGTSNEVGLSASFIQLTTNTASIGIGNDATQAATGWFYLLGVNETARTMLTGSSTNMNTGGENACTVDGGYDATTTINAIRIRMNSGNITAGTFKLYGVGS